MSNRGFQPDEPTKLAGHLKFPRNVFGLAMMITGAGCFVTFHFVEGGNIHGWELWKGLFEFIEDKSLLDDREALLGFSGLLTLTIVTIVSPCLISWLFQNPWIKWCLAGFSAMAAGIMWYFVAAEGADSLIVTLALTPTLTLIGLLCIRTSPRHPPPHSPT